MTSPLLRVRHPASFGPHGQRLEPAYVVVPCDPPAGFHDERFPVVGFRSIKVWVKAHQLTLAVYEATGSFPSGERFGLTSQIRRSASSICADIAEGVRPWWPADFARSTDFARRQRSWVSLAIGRRSRLDWPLF